jgi:hypothetical protein
MTESAWVFGCKLGLAQDSCGRRHEKDHLARGYGSYPGCPACIHREAGNEATKRAEEEYAKAPRA